MLILLKFHSCSQLIPKSCAIDSSDSPSLIVHMHLSISMFRHVIASSCTLSGPGAPLAAKQAAWVVPAYFLGGVYLNSDDALCPTEICSKELAPSSSVFDWVDRFRESGYTCSHRWVLESLTCLEVYRDVVLVSGLEAVDHRLELLPLPQPEPRGRHLADLSGLRGRGFRGQSPEGLRV